MFSKSPESIIFPACAPLSKNKAKKLKAKLAPRSEKNTTMSYFSLLGLASRLFRATLLKCST
jgi:hypothetical protein